MYIIKNSLRNLSRSLGRNILIGIIVLVIAVSSCIALSIKQAAKTAETEGLENLQITATISANRRAMMQSGGDMKDKMSQISSLSLEEMQKYAKSEYVKDFIYSINTSVSKSDSIEPVDTSSSDSSTAPTTGENSSGSTDWRSETGKAPGKGGFAGMGVQGDFTIKGYSSESAMTSFVSGTSKISDGEMFDIASADQECIISAELATLNSLKVGSEIKLVNPNLETEVYTLKVVGIYTTTESSDNMMRFSTANDPANQIYMSYAAVNALCKKSSSSATTGTDDNGNTTTTALRSQVSGSYAFTDVDSYNAFAKQVYTMGLDENYTVSSSDLTNYEQSLVPLKNISKFANVFLIVVLCIGAIILVVLNIFNVRERKYEIGVLTAIGMKKFKVGLQFLAELFVITVAAIMIGTGIGAVASVPTANMLLSEQISSQQNASQQQMQNFGRPDGNGNSGNGSSSNSDKASSSDMQSGGGKGGFQGFMNKSVDYVSSINAATDWSVVLALIGIGVALTLISGSVSVIYILRYEPLKILSNRT